MRCLTKKLSLNFGVQIFQAVVFYSSFLKVHRMFFSKNLHLKKIVLGPFSCDPAQIARFTLIVIIKMKCEHWNSFVPRKNAVDFELLLMQIFAEIGSAVLFPRFNKIISVTRHLCAANLVMVSKIHPACG